MGIDAVELFDKARGGDGILSKAEFQDSGLACLSVDDWRAIARAYNAPGKNPLAFGRLELALARKDYIEERPGEFIVNNPETNLNMKKVWTGLTGILKTGALGGGGYFLGGRMLLDRSVLGRAAGLAVGLGAAYIWHRQDMKEIDAIKAEAMPLRIPKSALGRSR